MRSTVKKMNNSQIVLTLFLLGLLASCAKPKQGALTAEDMSVLENSTFNPGEKVSVENPDSVQMGAPETAAEMAARGADGGFIGQPGSGTAGPDTGVIAQPGSSTPPPAPPVVPPAPVVVTNPVPAPIPSQPTGSSSGSTVSSNPAPSTPAPSTPSSGSGSTVATGSSTPQPGGSDTGVIGQPINQGSDTGSVQAGNTASGSAGNTGSSPSGSTTVAGTPSSGSSTPSQPSGSGSTTSPSNPSVPSTGSTSSGTSSNTASTPQPSGSDTGNIAQNGNSGSDVGSTNPGTGVVNPTNGGSTGSSSNPPVIIVSNPGSGTSSGASSGTSSGTTSGSNSNPVVPSTGSGSTGSTSPSSPQPSGSDTGNIAQNGNSGSDVGNTNPGTGVVNPTNGGSTGSSSNPPVIVATNSGSGTSSGSPSGSNSNPSAPNSGSGSTSIPSGSNSNSNPTQPSGNDNGNIGSGGQTKPDNGTQTGSNVPSSPGGTTTTPTIPGTSIPIPTINAGGNTIADLIKQIINTAIQIVTNLITGNKPDSGNVAQGGGSTVDHGNNGVGNGLDPQPPGNPPINDGPGTSPGNPGNTGGNPGVKPTSGNCACSTHNKPAPKPNLIDIGVGRACSEKRSKVSAPRFVFFEEAKRPILSMEAMSKSTYAQCQRTVDLIAHLHYDISGAYCGCVPPKTTLVASYNLSNLDMIESKNSVKAEFNLAALKKQLGSEASNSTIAVTVCDDTNNDGKCSDEKPSNILSILPPSFSLKSVPKKLQIDVWSGRNRTLAADPESCDKQYSPLLLDLTGEGFKLSGPENGVYFDLNNTGTPVATGWADAGNMGFLVRDLNKDGGISSGAELFGNATKLQNGEIAANGFEALKDLDNDKDMLFTFHDSAWRTVKVWIDKNQNGIAERRELFTLDDLRIESINLNYLTVFEVDQFGNQTKQRSVFKRTVNAGAGIFQIIDVWFQTLSY